MKQKELTVVRQQEWITKLCSKTEMRALLLVRDTLGSKGMIQKGGRVVGLIRVSGVVRIAARATVRQPMGINRHVRR